MYYVKVFYFKRFRILFFLILCFFMFSCSKLEKNPGKYSYKLGDNSTWSKIDYDDSHWVGHVDKDEEDIFWVRANVIVAKEGKSSEELGVYLSAFGAYQIYWDGVKIGDNGELGSEGNKVGSYIRFFKIPVSLSNMGAHVLSLRTSQKYYSNQPTILEIKLSNYFSLVRKPLKWVIYVNILAGAFLITFIHFLILFFNDKKSYPTLLVSISSLLFFLLIITEYVKFYIPIHYSYFYVRLEIITILTLIISFLIPFYFLIQFSLSWKKPFLIAYFLFLLSIYFVNHEYGDYDELNSYLTFSMWASAVFIVGSESIRGNKGAILIFIGLIINFVSHTWILSYDYSMLLSSTILLLSMIYILGLKTMEQRRKYEQSLVLTTRLRHELLKKNIQPHFLMNTLTSLIDWVEQAPKTGVRFIEALAKEFEIINDMENERLIPITMEIDLCKNHLEIMGYRREIDYTWSDSGININEKVPPAIFHTLVENGITHCLPRVDGTMRFELFFKSRPTMKTYEFYTHGTLRKLEKEIKEGTGIKYIKSRLIESYGDDWEFESSVSKEGWKNKIILYSK